MIIWLASYPRSGNTFFRVILNSIFEIKTYSIYNDKDIGSDEETSNVVGHNILPQNFDLEEMRRSKQIYYIKTHEHYDQKVSPEDKVIYLIRDGRESTLSFTKHQNIYGKKNKTLFDTIYGDTWIGSWGEHVKSWEKFPKGNILYIHFEALTDHPSEQIGSIANFLDIHAVNNRIPTFEELKTTNPKFFRSGKKDSWKDAYSQEEHIAFWYKHAKVMEKYGYLDSKPEIFNRTELDLLYEAVETDKNYMKDMALSSQKENDYETEIKTFKSSLENHKKELCLQTKKSEFIEKKLNKITSEISHISAIKFFKNPIQKYQVYKKILHTYHTFIKQPYIREKIFLLPTDEPYKNPDKHYCISEHEHPVLIYQVGKVGSSSIYVSLKEQMKNLPVYQVHNITTAQKLLEKDIKEDSKNGIAHFTMGIALKKKITEEPNIQWKIIIGVREPISRWISDIFENIHTRYKFLKNSDGSVNVEKTIKFIKETVDEEPQEKWFNDELLSTFGINILDIPFDGDYQISNHGKIDILAYKFENMQEYVPSVVKDFLSLNDFNLATANATSEKSTAGAYQEVKRKLKFEVDFLVKFYKKSVVNHFYTDKEIKSFTERWKA